MTESHHCLKKRYANEHSARNKLHQLRIKRRKQHKTKTEQRAYQCQLCRAWHLTSHAFEL
jgi:hypothetical protein